MKKWLQLILFFSLLFFIFPVFSEEKRQEKSHQLYFLTLADIHFDPFIACYASEKRPCPLIKKLSQASANEWPAILKNDQSQTLPAQYKQDTSYVLLMNLLSKASEEARIKQVDFVVVLGDFFGHHYYKFYKKYSEDKTLSGYQSFAKKSLLFLMQALKEAFPDNNIYAVVGNNDTYRHNYAVQSNGKFFHEASMIFSTGINNKLARDEMQKTFNQSGFYALDLGAPSHLRLIVLNSVLFSTKARGNDLRYFADQQLIWLDRELKHAKNKHQKVLIAMHIPPTVDVYATANVRLFTFMTLWQRAYIEKFQQILKAHSAQIAAVLTGHVHYDFMQVMNLDATHDVLITGTPSVSPIFGNQPGFNVYGYDLGTQQINSHEAYYWSAIDRFVL